ncbi:MAG: ABC transporter substrate-binding protein [Corynebacterium sp.]|nr:ABC transporter substrate-binding protein [Corynebacterium sp.]
MKLQRRNVRYALISAASSAALLLGACSTPADDATTSVDGAGAAGESASVGASANSLVITDNYGEKTIPQPVETVVVTDNRAFEILADWGVKVAAAPLGIVPQSLEGAYNRDTVAIDLGMHTDPNLEGVVAVQPDLVWNGQRFTQHQKALEELLPNVPVVDFSPREDGQLLDQELIRHTKALGEVFGHEAEAQKLIDDFTAAVARARAAYDPEMKVIAVNTTGGKIGFIAPTVGRTFGPVYDLLGLTPALEVEGASDDHQGDDISVEAIAQANPDFIMVLDRDAAVASDEPGYTPGADLIKNNPALRHVKAIENDAVLVAPADTYRNEGIITYTEILNALADSFEEQSAQNS